MTRNIYKFECDAPEIDAREALRYAGVRGESPEAEELLSEVIAESADAFRYRAVYTLVGIEEAFYLLGYSPIGGEARDYSELLSSRLLGAERALIFAATVGAAPDRLIRRYEVTSPAGAVMLDALGSERVEALADELCLLLSGELALDGYRLLPRFSPGYGDLPLSLQSRILSILDASKHIGVSLNEGLLMSPSKSVTAIAGIVREKEKME